MIRKFCSRALGIPKLRSLKFVRSCFMLFGNCNHLEHLLQPISQWNWHIIISVKFYLLWLFSAQNYSAFVNGIHYEHWNPRSELGLFSGYSLNIETVPACVDPFSNSNLSPSFFMNSCSIFWIYLIPFNVIVSYLFFGINAKLHHDLCLLLVLFLVFSSID